MNYHNITTEDMNNGDGLRTVLWVAGCAHHCKGCQNPQTWDADGGIPFDDDAMVELLTDLEKDYISGLTLSGGDPLFEGNRKVIESVIEQVRAKFGDSKTIWMYTGHVWENIYQLPMMKNIDVLVDGPFVLEERDVSLKWKGSPNQRVINVNATLTSETPKIPILHCNDEEEFAETEMQLFNAKAASCCG